MFCIVSSLRITEGALGLHAFPMHTYYTCKQNMTKPLHTMLGYNISSIQIIVMMVDLILKRSLLL